MEKFNLNTDDYSSKDLMNLFGLSNSFTIEDVSRAKKNLANKLKQTDTLGVEQKNHIILFLDTVENKLNNIIYVQKTPTNTQGTWAETSVPIKEYGSHIIIENPNSIAGKQSKITEGRIAIDGVGPPPGFLNPINVRSVTQAISIDTRFRSKYYQTSSSQFSIELPEVQKKVVTLRIASIDLPVSWHAINPTFGNDTMLLLGDDPNIIYGTGNSPASPPGDWEKYTVYSPNNSIQISKFRGGPNKLLYSGWLMKIPAGNYEVSWQSRSYAAYISQTINQSINTAAPGVVNEEGEFAFLFENQGFFQEPPPTPPPPPPDPIYFLNNFNYVKDASDANQVEFTYLVDRISGRSIFASSFDLSSNTPPSYQQACRVKGMRFNVNSEGSLDMNNNIQLKLGWQLGFRVAEYVLGEGLPEQIQPSGAVEFNRDIKRVAAVSEGICVITGPRYGFISLNDFQKNSGPSYLMAYNSGALEDNIITRLNLAALQNEAGVYQISSDPGLSTELNRSREYFGPVDITKIEVKLLDEYGRLIDLNSMDWSFTITFEKLYD